VRMRVQGPAAGLGGALLSPWWGQCAAAMQRRAGATIDARTGGNLGAAASASSSASPSLTWSTSVPTPSSTSRGGVGPGGSSSWWSLASSGTCSAAAASSCIACARRVRLGARLPACATCKAGRPHHLLVTAAGRGVGSSAR
jgi:hypothetical protein